MTLERSYVPPGPRSYRPPIGIPERESRRRLQGLLGSIALHLLVALVFIIPVVIGEVTAVREHRNGGGPGPAGGGGGGTNGTGGQLIQERLLYTPLTPAPTANPTPLPQLQPPEPPKPVPPEEEVPPQPVPPPPPPPQETAPPTATATVPPNAAASGASAAPTLGEGGGSGRDGTAGNGPGSGGGVGSGIGTGRGSGVGPGTGGGPDSIYPPTLVTLALPPLQPPSNVRPYKLVALFDVDEKGNTKLVEFNETRDRKFNSKVREVLAEVRFRPAVRGDGTPVRHTGRFEIEYP